MRRGSAIARFLGLRVRILPGRGYLSVVFVVSCQVEVYVRSVSSPEESYE